MFIAVCVCLFGSGFACLVVRVFLGGCVCVCMRGFVCCRLLACLSMSVRVCVSACCVHICVWASLQGPCVPMRTLLHCVSDTLSLFIRTSGPVSVHLCFGPARVSLCVAVSCGSVCVCSWVSVPRTACVLSIFVCECVSVCQSWSLCWGRGKFAVYVGFPVSIYLPLSVPPACLSFFPPASSPASLPAVCICIRGQQAVAHELRMVYIFKWLRERSKV